MEISELEQMRVTFKFKLYRSKRNRHLHRQIDIAAKIYNHCIALHRRYYRLFGKHLHKYKLQKHITKLKKLKKYQYWKQIGSKAIQDITDRIDRAYKLFFNALKSDRKVAPPGFKKRFRYKSFTLKHPPAQTCAPVSVGYRLLENNRLQIGSRIFKYHKSREIEGKIKTLTVKRDTLGDIFIFFSCEVLNTKQANRVMTGKNAGFDFGLKVFLKSSDDSESIVSPLFFKKSIKEIKKANKNLSKKKRGSNNWRKARLQLARVHKRIANRRKDFHFKLARKLSETYDYLFFEDLDIKGMQRMWGRKISDLGFSNFLRIQEHFCQKNGSVLSYIDKWYPSSKLCHVCEHVNEKLSLKEREWVCPSCKTHHDRDENAAINILREGTSSLGLGDVRPPLVAISV